MQKSLFPQKQLQQLQVNPPRHKRVWQAEDKFPFGAWKGSSMKLVATMDPGYFQWWMKKSKADISKELQEEFDNYKYLAQ